MSFTPNPLNEINGLERLKDGSLYLIIASLLLIIGDFIAFTLIGTIIAFIIALVLVFLSYSRLREGFGILQSYGKNTSLGKTGATLLLAGAILDLIGGILLLVIVGAFFIIIGAIFAIIGEIFVGIGLYNTGSAYNVDLLKIGGILVAIIITAFIGYILAYISLGDIINKFRSGQLQSQGFPSYPPINPQGIPGQPTNIYQIGTGSLKGDGTAYLTIYSPTTIQMVSAEIVNAQLMSSSISPPSLVPGNNNIRISFGQITSLTPNMTYTIRITLLNGQTIDTIVTYQP